MPVISITLLPGYPADARERLVDRVATAARSVVLAPEAGTTVFVHEAATYRRDGRIASAGGPVVPEATPVVRAFLEAMGRRDLEAASQWLAPGFEMVFPGGRVMRQLPELVAWAKGRYQSVDKRCERFEESWQGDVTVVHCSGTLQGRWPDGTAFEGVRFIDRFEVEGGKIRRQEVWNDLAEARSGVTL